MNKQGNSHTFLLPMPYVYIAVMYIHVIGLTATLFLHGYHALCYSL